MIKYIILLFLCVVSLNANAFENENFHNKKWCAMMHKLPVIELVKGTDYEVRTPWRGFVDCLLPKYAVEADWDYKYRDGLMQAMEYGVLMNRRPAVLLIRRNGDNTYIERARIMVRIYSFPVTIFVMDRE